MTFVQNGRTAMAQHLSIDTPLGALAVRTAGDPDLPTALLWHSLFVDDRFWARVEPQLARARRLIPITGPGHGKSSDPHHRYTLGDCAAAAAVVLDAMEVHEPVDWLGNAWGGHVGIVFAATWPQRCRSLITVGTPVHAYPLKDRLRIRALLDAYRLVGPVRFVRDAVAGALLSAQTRQGDPEAQQLVRSAFAGADRAGMANAVESISLRRPDLTPMLSLVAVRTLFITGSEHPDWSPRQAQEASALLPTAPRTRLTVRPTSSRWRNRRSRPAWPSPSGPTPREAPRPAGCWTGCWVPAEG